MRIKYATIATMIDPVTSLAMTMRSTRGAYSVLLGSGVSRSAGIPTGWEVILDLTRQVAHASGENCQPDPAEWYRNKFKSEPSYSELLNTIGKTPTERGGLLKSYFEPNEDEREQGLKQPTDAHKAIAALASSGYVRVILTTNFDRLMEQALTEAGVQHQVIATPDGVDGALPLAHATCTVIKLHGDYQDIRIKNTPEELSIYDGRFNKLLDRVFDEYGLIVAGWSGDWDAALVAAMERCQSHRFVTAWLAVSAPRQNAKKLIGLRRASIVQTDSADAFFSELYEKIRALEDFDSPHMISAPLAVAALKRYLRDPRHSIKLHDLIQTETKRALAQIDSYQFSASGRYTVDELKDRISKCNSALAVLIPLMVHGAYWARDEFGFWTKAIERFSDFPAIGGTVALVNLRCYPAFLLFQAAGISAVAGKNWKFLAELMRHTTVRTQGKRSLAAVALAYVNVFSEGIDRDLPVKPSKIPVSQLIRDQLALSFQELLPTESEFEAAVDRFEYLNGLIYVDITNQGWGPVGAFALKGGFMAQAIPIIEEIRLEAESYEDRWPLIQSGVFGSIERFKEVSAVYDKLVFQLANQFRFR